MIPMLIAAQHGLGATVPQLIGTTGQVAGATVGTLATTILSTSAIGGPVGIAIGAGIAAISTLLAVAGVGEGCGQSCITASNNANQIEQQMKDNLAAFQAGAIDQATALANYSILWNAYKQMCEQVNPGGGCITDRQAGACKWKDASGQCWNWDIGYRAPIAARAPQGTAPTASITSIVGSMSLAEWLLLGIVSWGVAEAVS